MIQDRLAVGQDGRLGIQGKGVVYQHKGFPIPAIGPFDLHRAGREDGALEDQLVLTRLVGTHDPAVGELDPQVEDTILGIERQRRGFRLRQVKHHRGIDGVVLQGGGEVNGHFFAILGSMVQVGHQPVGLQRLAHRETGQQRRRLVGAGRLAQPDKGAAAGAAQLYHVAAQVPFRRLHSRHQQRQARLAPGEPAVQLGDIRLAGIEGLRQHVGVFIAGLRAAALDQIIGQGPVPIDHLGYVRKTQQRLAPGQDRVTEGTRIGLRVASRGSRQVTMQQAGSIIGLLGSPEAQAVPIRPDGSPGRGQAGQIGRQGCGRRGSRAREGRRDRLGIGGPGGARQRRSQRQGRGAAGCEGGPLGQGLGGGGRRRRSA